ncbi:hypothetical protein [Methylomonas koyamae]|nr:hypothetical protein [Methylomonas koyamae]WNB77443.1 hypothetical protein RI210_07640 [Methylomonas koyamae]
MKLAHEIRYILVFVSAQGRSRFPDRALDHALGCFAFRDIGSLGGFNA